MATTWYGGTAGDVLVDDNNRMQAGDVVELFLDDVFTIPATGLVNPDGDGIGNLSTAGPRGRVKFGDPSGNSVTYYSPVRYLSVVGILRPDPTGGAFEWRPDPGQVFGKVVEIDLRDYGKLGLNIDDDNSSQYQQALDEAAAGDSMYSTIRIPETKWGIGIAGRKVAPRGVYAIGATNRKGTLGQRPGAAFRMLTEDAGVEFGVETQGTSIQGGRWGNFTVDGRGIAKQPLRVKLMSQADTAGPVQVKNAARTTDPSGANDPTGGGDPANDLAWHRANCAVLMDSIQNSRMIFNIANNAACGLVIDRAASGNTLEIEVADSGSVAASPPPGGWAMVIQQSEDGTLPGAMSPQTVSSNNTIKGRGGIERTGPAAYGLLNHLAGFKTSFGDMFLADGKPNVGSRPLIRQRNLGMAPSGPLHIGKVSANGGKNTGTAMDIGNRCSIVLTDASNWRNFQHTFKLGETADVRVMTGQFWSNDNVLDPTSTGTLEENVTMPADAALVVSRQSASAPIIRGKVAQQSALVTTTAGSTTVSTTDGSVKFGPANVGASIKIAAAGALGTDGVTRADLSTVVASVASDGKSLTVNVAPSVSLTNAYANYSEKFHRFEETADGTRKSGDGTVAPTPVVTPAQWPQLIKRVVNPQPGGFLARARHITSTAVGTPTSGVMSCVPFDIGGTGLTVADLEVLQNTQGVNAGGSTMTATLALYRASVDGTMPDWASGPVFSGSFDAAAANGTRTVVPSSTLTVPAGAYWLVWFYLVTGTPTTAAQFTCINAASNAFGLNMVDQVTVARTLVKAGLTALPTSATPLTPNAGATSPAVLVKTA